MLGNFSARFCQVIYTASEWTSVNTILYKGELGIESDTLRMKIGDGVTAWGSLAYYSDFESKYGYLINGRFDIWQRATSFAITVASNNYTADRWFVTLNQRTSGTLTVARNTADKESDDNYCVEIDCTSLVTTGVVDFTQIIKTLDVVKMRGKTITFTVRLKANTGTPTAVLKIIDGTDTNAYPVTATTSDTVNCVLSTAYQDFKVTHIVSATATSLAYRVTSPSAYAQKIYICKARDNFYNYSLPVQDEDDAITLKKCMEYYEKSYTYSVTPGTATADGMENNSSYVVTGQPLKVNIKYKVPKRISISPGNGLTIYDTLGNSGKCYFNGANSAYGTSIQSEKSCVLLSGNASSSTTYEYAFQWVADTEL